MADGPPLWSWDALVAAAEGTADGTPASVITGFSIDTRSLVQGEVFVALTDQRDGHDFVAAAFAAGAAAALVRRDFKAPPGAGPLIRVDDPLRALGRVSYSFYLVHWMIVVLVARAVDGLGIVAAAGAIFGAGFALSAIAATLSWWVAERPYFARRSTPLRTDRVIG